VVERRNIMIGNKKDLKLKIVKNKLSKGQVQLGIFFNKDYNEKYIYICLLKYNIAIGFMF
jgi:hypothetical protein